MVSASARRRAMSRLELHFGRRGALRRRLEERLGPEARYARDDAARKQTEPRVVLAHRLVVALALDGDTIIRPFELRLERQEVGVRLELGISLDGDEQAAQRAGQLVLRGL